MKLLSRAGAAMLLALAVSVAPSMARTWTVNTLGENGTNSDVLCSLRNALTAARDNSTVHACAPTGEADDTILLPTGTYTFGPGDFFLNGGGSLTIARQTSSSIVTVNLIGGTFLNAQNLNGTLTLRGFTVQNGTGAPAVMLISPQGVVIDSMHFDANSGVGGGSGGAVRLTGTLGSGGLHVLNSVFSNNSADNAGGGMSVVPSGGPMLMEDVVFTNNTVTPSSSTQTPMEGGALNVGVTGNTFECRRCIFGGLAPDEGNSATVTAAGGEVQGGAVRALSQAGGSIVFVDTRIVGSVGSGGSRITGGLWVKAQNSGTVTLDRVVVDSSTIDPGVAGEDVRLQAVTGGKISLTDAQVSFDSNDANGVDALADGAGSSVAIGQTTIADYSLVGAVLAASNGGSLVLQNSLLTSVTDSTATAGVTKSGNCERPNNYGGFVDHGAGDYRLKVPVPVGVTSAIDVAADNQPTQKDFDLDHYKRVVGIHPDCGAYESSSLFADGLELGELGSWSGVR